MPRFASPCSSPPLAPRVPHLCDIRLRIGVALQDSSIDGKQSGRETLQLQGRLYGLGKRDIQQRMHDVIGLVDIGSAIDDPSIHIPAA